jgi:hypothetical protein
MKLIENIVPKNYRDEIERVVCGPTFPWFYTELLGNDSYFANSYENPKISNPMGLTHLAFIDGKQNSDAWPLIKPILYFLEEKEGIDPNLLLRCRFRKTFQTIGHTEGMYNMPHVDLPDATPYKTLVYYVEDSDGDTVLFNETWKFGEPTVRDLNITEAGRFSPVKGNAVLFDGWQFHAGNSPVKYKRRTVINFDFSVN